MENCNWVDVLGLLFLAYGMIDGFRKGLVKKGIFFCSSIVTLIIVYMASPYVAGFLREILPSFLSLETLVGEESEIYQMLRLSGLGERAEASLYVVASRVLAIAVSYLIVRVMLRTLLFSLEILTKVPGLSLVNRVTGMIFGLLQQLLVLWLLFLAVAVLSVTPWGAWFYEMIGSSIWMKWLYDHNLLLLIGLCLLFR